ncbi:hypothetical protein FHS78_002734 [Parvibaculum indicum]|uniref:DUF1835 domain-containing protein n=1 Tax=Parvibaculum indicum TaxID=562969 RepID=UPI0014248E11|nr:DUF1835 domain-containing protein [Parvibaculum indicum]NIJ42440.1 hypothetical protein [Parvibaculum indicum]
MTDPDAAFAANPFRLNLEQQKKRARELQRAVDAGDAAALLRAQAQRQDLAPPLRLADAQFVIARELGLPSWPKLKSHIEALDSSAGAIRAGRIPDADMPTLHIRCGHDIGEALALAGFEGRFLEYSDPFCQGPVVPGDDWLARRVDFLAEAYGEEMDRPKSDIRAGLMAEEAGLARAHDYQRVALWFEHDSYDQLILARVLAVLAEMPGRPRIELVSTDAFPGGERFIGIGQLPPEALHLLWSRRARVTEAQCALGARIWSALRADDPTDLWTIAENGAAALPFMKGALDRHLQELPGAGDGLSLTQRLILRILDERGSLTAGRIFAALMREYEPLPWLGDLMFWRILAEMALAETPVLTVEPGGAWPQRMVALTDTGRACLAGRIDYMDLAPPERWVGGVRLLPGAPVWRWDGAAGQPVRGR